MSRDGALRRLQEAASIGEGFDCVIIDHAFSGDGLGFVAGLRRANPFPLPKFIMLAGISALQETGQWMDAGIDAYVNKPVRQRELLSALAKILMRSGELEEFAATSSELVIESDISFDAYLLVAEDNTVNQELMRAMLEGMGCRIEITNNGREAFEAISERELDAIRDPYKLILMDCQMPDVDGFSATSIIREYERKFDLARIPIIAITANAMSGDRDRCLEAGMDDYLSKPFTRAQLVDILERWLPLESVIKKQGPPALNPMTGGTNFSTIATAIDLTALRKIQALQRRDAPDILTKVIGLYEKAVPRLLQDMHAALKSSDGELLQQAAHSLKSSSASLGAMACAESCRQLEDIGRSGEISAASAQLDTLEFEVDVALAALRQHIETAKNRAA